MIHKPAAAAGFALALAAFTAPAASAAPTEMIIGNVPSLTGAPLYIAKEKGYYAAGDLDVKIEYPGTPGDMAAMLSTNRLQAIGTGFSAGFFNLLEKKIPVTIVMSRAVSPINHYILLSPAMKDKIKTPADLKGHVVGIDGRGSGIMYEVDKVLAQGGLTFADVEVKYIPLTQTPVALSTGAIDAAMLVSPIQDLAIARGLAVPWINTDDVVKPQPMISSSLVMNKEWISQHQAAAEHFVTATIRGIRDYCQAYHHGPNRAEVVGYLAKYSDLKDTAMIDKLQWGSMDVNGRVLQDSLSDIQDFFVKEKLIPRKYTQDEIGPPAWATKIADGFEPFKLIHDDGTPGCR